MPLTTSKVPTSEASSWTIQRQVQQMQKLHETLGVDLGEELRALARKERGDFLKGAALLIEMPPEHSLAMKANLTLSWSKLRT